MSNIMTFIEGYMTGNAWEELCVKCYRLRYQREHYTAIPAVQGGDAGIEGFTHNGIVHQCYCTLYSSKGQSNYRYRKINE